MSISAADVKKLRDMTGAGMMACKKALTENDGDMEKAIESLRKAGAAKAAKRAEREANEGKVWIDVTDAEAVMWEVNSETDFVARNEDFLGFGEALGPILLAEKPADIDAAMALSPAVFGQSVSGKQTELVGKIGENITFSRFNIIPVGNGEKAFSYIHGNGKIGVVIVLTSDSDSALNSDVAAELGKDLAMQIAAFNPAGIDRSAITADIIENERRLYTEQMQESGKPANIIEKIVNGKIDKYFQEIVLLEQAFVKDTGKTVTDQINEVSKAAGGFLSVKQFVRYQIGQ